MSAKVNHDLVVATDIKVAPDENAAKDLPAELQPAYEALEKIFRDADAVVIDARLHLQQKYYKAGREVAKLKKKASTKGEGEKAIGLLAGALGINPRTLHNAANVAATYTPEEFKSLCSHPSLTWNHTVRLAAVPDREHREKLAAESEEQHLSVSKLTEKVRELTGPQKPRGSGRPPGVPATPGAALRRIYKSAHSMRTAFGDVWLGERYDAVDQISGLEEKVPDGLKDDTEAAIEELELLRSELSHHVGRLREAVQWIDQAEASVGDDPGESGFTDESDVEDDSDDEETEEEEEETEGDE